MFEKYIVFQYWHVNDWRESPVYGKQYRSWAWLVIKLRKDGMGQCLFVHWGKWGDGTDFPGGKAFPVTAGFHGWAEGNFDTGTVFTAAFNYRGEAGV